MKYSHFLIFHEILFSSTLSLISTFLSKCLKSVLCYDELLEGLYFYEISSLNEINNI